MLSWRWLLMQAACQPVCFAEPSAGNNNAAKIAIIAITTSSSISVNPLVVRTADEAIYKYLLYVIYIERQTI
jgi:hypothetical protein